MIYSALLATLGQAPLLDAMATTAGRSSTTALGAGTVVTAKASSTWDTGLVADVVVGNLDGTGIDGWAVLAALKTDARTAKIPILITTIVEDRARGEALGADDFLTKPINPERLGELIRKYRDEAQRRSSTEASQNSPRNANEHEAIHV